MAGIGSAWGSREEMLHPRDKHGRFRKKWKMAAAVVDALSSFLDRFSPRTFQSDQQAAQYSFNHKKGAWTTPELQRLHTDWDDANAQLQTGQMDKTTKLFVDMMDRKMVPTQDDLIVSQTVPVEAFGLNPQTAALEDGGLEDLIGLEIGDAGYGDFNLGSELSHPPGSVTLRVALPKGTRVAYGGRSPNDRALFVDRDQPLVVTKVEPDGRGGYYILAIAGSGKRTQGATQIAEDRTHGPRGSGLTPEQREARVTPRMSGESRLQTALKEQQANEAATLAHQRQVQGQPPPPSETPVPAPTPAPAPAAPASPQTPASPASGVPERQEPVLKDAVGPGSPEGKSPSDIAQEAEAARVQAENAPPPAPAPRTPDSFRQAVADQNLQVPSRGPQRKEWNDAYQGITSGKKTPQDALRELESDIQHNQGLLDDPSLDPAKKKELESNLRAQVALAEAIGEHHGLPTQGRSNEGETHIPAPPTAAKKAGPKATPGAPSTKRESVPSPKVQEERGLDRMTRPELLAEAGMKSSRMNKDQLREIVRAKRAGGGEAPPAPAPAKKAPGSKFTPAQEEALVNRAKQFRGKERNDEERRIVAEADAIEARGKAPAKKAAAKKAAAKKAAPEKMVPGDQRVPDTESPAVRQANESLRAVAKKATPAKAAPTPADAAEEAFKARVAEAGLPDRVTALRAMARDQKIRGFSTMNKKQLQSALLGDEVPRAGKLPVVPPAKMIPHLQAAESDQAARALLANHTLADLKALAKERELTLPKKGATKPRVTDMVLEDIRGPQEGIQGRTPDTSLQEDLGNLGYIDLPGSNGNQISQQIAQVDGDDPDSLRQRRDDLEKLSKQFRADGDKNAANMAQAAADAMGMRAQTISGVEEATPPVKRVAKKAVPEVPEGEVPPAERPIEKMLKPELLDLARREGASAVRPSWSKAKILDEIKRNRRMDSSRGPETADERMRRELGQLPGGPERDLGPNQGPLQLPNRAPTPEEIARDAGETPAPVKKATKKAAKKAVANVDQAAGNLATQVRATEDGSGGTFGDQLRNATPAETEELRAEIRKQGLEPRGKTAEELFDNSVKDMLENRMRELGMLPEDPKKPTKAQKRVPKGSVKGPKADVPIATQDRRDSFTEAWDKQNLGDDASTIEVRDRIASGEFTHEEGVRRLESEIGFNEDEISDLGAELRGMAPEDRDGADSIHARRAELQDKITAQKKAVKFLRTHAKNEAPVTRQELETKLPDAEKAALQRVEVDDLKAAAKAEGLGNIEGDDKDTVVANISKAMQRRELANQEKEQKARDLQARKDVVRQHAEAISGIESVIGGSDRAVQARIRSQSTASKLSPELRQELLDNAGDRTALQGVLDRVARENGLRRIDTRGQETHFDPERHDLPPGSGIQKGDPVTVLEPGFRSDVEGHDVQVKKAKVTEGHGGVPSGEPTGVSTPAQTPVQAAPGTAAGRITTARLTPGTRIMVQRGQTEGLVMPTTKKTGAIPVTVTSVGGVGAAGPRGRGKYRVTVTDDDGNVLKLGDRGASQTHMLEPAPKAAKVAKAVAPIPETPAAPKKAAKMLPPLKDGTQRKSLTNVEVGDVIQPAGRKQGPAKRVAKVEKGIKGHGYPMKITFDDGTVMTGMPQTAVWMGKDTPSAPETPSTPTPAKVAKAAVPAKAAPAPPKVVDLDNPTRHNVEVIGTGLDLEPKGADRDWLGIVQRDLDRGTDGRQIANDLRREADSQRTIHNIQEAIAPGTGGPAGRIDRMERMADRLEGVRPIQAPEAPAKAAPSGPAKREMGTMAAATAQTRAFSDLRAGKSHAEVATALRQAATSVGSKDHDPQFVRPLEFSPAERSAMKRSDAKALRELASQIQAEGVAQRTEARAAKKAASPAGKKAAKAQAEFVDRMAGERAAFEGLGDKPAKKAVRPAGVFSDDAATRAAAVKEMERFEAEVAAGRAAAKKAAPGETVVSPAVDRMVRQGGTLPGQNRRLSELREAAAPPPKKRTAAEMRRAQALAGPDYPLEQVLADWDRQKEERKNLTGPVGEMIVRQMDDAMRRLQEAKTPGKEDDALAGLLAPELRQLATRLGLDSKGSKATLLQRIKDRVKGREGPTTSAERAVPKAEAPGGATVSGVDYSDPALLQEGHAKDAVYLLNTGDTPQDLVDSYIEDGLSPDMAKLLISEITKARQVQMPQVVRDAIDEQIKLRGRTRTSLADLRSSLKGIDPVAFDQVLRQLAREGRLQTQENQQQLTPEDRAAAFKIGARTYHFVTRSS